MICQSFNSSNNFTEIINNPCISDFDNSKTIDLSEAIFLGFAMSADSLVCGIGFSISDGFTIIFPFFVALFQFLFLSFGFILGKKIKSIASLPPSFFSKLAGSILIFIGFINFL